MAKEKDKIELPLPPEAVTWKYPVEAETEISFITAQLNIGQMMHSGIEASLSKLQELGYPETEIEHIREQFTKPVEEREPLKRSPELEAWLEEVANYTVDIFERLGIPRAQSRVLVDKLIGGVLVKHPIADPVKIRNSLQAQIRAAAAAFKKAPPVAIPEKPEKIEEKLTQLKSMFDACRAGVKRFCEDLRNEIISMVEQAFAHPTALFDTTVELLRNVDLGAIADDTQAIYDSYRKDIDTVLIKYGEAVITPYDLKKELPALSKQLGALGDTIDDYLAVMPKEELPEKEEVVAEVLRTTKLRGKYAGYKELVRDFKDEKTGKIVGFYAIKVDPATKKPNLNIFFRTEIAVDTLFIDISSDRIKAEGWDKVIDELKDKVKPEFHKVIFTNMEADWKEMEEYVAGLK